ncbi:MAG: periplasmic heavy metal sensor [Betaproteobacteria bacterium]|nr:periplasmic heavy metal sensor [Betaproteobacteria bacterium]
MNRLIQVFLVVTGLLSAPLAVWAGPGMGGGFALPPQAKERLQLTPEQNAQWDYAVQQTRAAREAMKQARQEMKQATQAELAKPEPDLAALAALGDSVQARNQQSRHAARTEWLKLYASFSGAQKTTVRDMMVKRIQRREEFREHMRERFSG